MLFRRIQIALLLLSIIFGVSLILANTSLVSAQENSYTSAEEALAAELDIYLAAIGEESNWQLGEVQVSGDYAFSIAKGKTLEGSYQGFVVLLAQKEADGLWIAQAPKVVNASVYNELLNKMPASLLNEFEKSYYYQYSPEEISLLIPRAVSMHHFPWPIRQTARLTQKDSTYHVNQVDFVLLDSNDVYASKPGIVVFVKESSDTGGCNIELWPYANFVVIQHSSNEYSWYVHLAKDSVPVKVGDLIGYGTKIGEQGNTGYACGSTGIHLHFMASTAIPATWPNPSVPNYAPWPPGGSIVTVDFIESAWSALVVDRVYESQNAPPPGICNATISQAVFYDNTYCNGQIFQQPTAGLVSLELIGLDDRIESIALPAGWSLGLYKDENELGPSLCLNQSDQMLWDNQFSDNSVVANQVSWFRLYKQPNCPYPDVLGIKFFPQPNFGGIPVWGMVGARFTNGPHHLAGSIYIPDGFSAKIYEFDDGGGNSQCFSASVLNLSDFGWSNHFIESVELIVGNNCESLPGDIPQPVLVKPLNNSTVYGAISPELCWQMDGSVQGYAFKVFVYNESLSVDSGWIIDSCWQAEGLIGQYGDYSWRVQAKNTEGTLSQWSLANRFSYVPDSIAPTAQMLTPLDNSTVKWPKANIIVNAKDNESGVARVHFFAWYDDGSATGYDWHYLGADESPEDGWRTIWNLTAVKSTDAAVWVYVEDNGGNFGSTFINGISVVEIVENDNGFGYRESKEDQAFPETGEIGSSQVDDDQASDLGSLNPKPSNTQPSNDGAFYTQGGENIDYVPTVSEFFTPLNGQQFYGRITPELCWQEVEGANIEYRVEIKGEQKILSPWMTTSCWQPSVLNGVYGSFDWRVKVQSVDGVKSPWSKPSSFVVNRDDVLPILKIISPIQGGYYSGQVPIQLNVVDLESGIGSIYMMVWYDENDGTGPGWHTIWESSSEERGSVDYVWDAVNIAKQGIQLWVYVQDNAGNLASSQISNIILTGDAQTKNQYQKSMVDVADTTRP